MKFQNFVIFSFEIKIKIHFPRRKLPIITFRKYKHFANETLLTSFKYEVDKQRAFLCENGLHAF